MRTKHTYKDTPIDERRTAFVSGGGEEDGNIVGVLPLSAAFQTNAPATATLVHGRVWGHVMKHHNVWAEDMCEGSLIGFLCFVLSWRLGGGGRRSHGLVFVLTLRMTARTRQDGMMIPATMFGVGDEHGSAPHHTVRMRLSAA